MDNGNPERKKKVKEIFEYRTAHRLTRINQELYEHLVGSIDYLLHYSEKYNAPLPKKSELLRMITRANSLIRESQYQPIGNTNKNNRQDNSTIFQKMGCSCM